MKHRFTRISLVTACALALGSPSIALPVGGIDTDALLAQLRDGGVVSSDLLSQLLGLDITALSLEELSALLDVLEALRSVGYDLADADARVQDQIAFLETVAQDVPIPASPY